MPRGLGVAARQRADLDVEHLGRARLPEVGITAGVVRSSRESVIRLRNLDPAKRPLRGFIDGLAQGPVLEMTARVSATASVELLFAPEYDPVAKLAVTQFPDV